VKQSAERLGVQKNVLRIGFDSSTEKMAIFIGLKQKKYVAPLPVKNGKTGALPRKKGEMESSFLPTGLPTERCPYDSALRE
jgi:hypothetical protein